MLAVSPRIDLLVGNAGGLREIDSRRRIRAPVYLAAKATPHSLSKSLRLQLKPLRITLTEVLPPLGDTPAVAHRRGVEQVCPGQVRMLPTMLRLFPRIAERMVTRT